MAKKWYWPWGQETKKEDSSKTHSKSYAAAAYNRLVTDWQASSASADAEIRGPLKVLRNRSRDLGRNNDYFKDFLREVQTNVVGPSGIPFQAQIKMERGKDLNEKLNNKVEDLWARWCRKENCDVAGKMFFADMERLLIREIAESGEVFVRKIYQKFGTSRIPLAIEILEADRVDDDMNGISSAGNSIVMGVEKDTWGRAVAYYIKPSHPGDNASVRHNYNSHTSIRIPANEIIHLGLIERWPQTRSVPWVASAIMRLHHMKGYEEAEVIAARASASVMGFITNKDGELKGDGVEGGERVSQFSPGEFKYLAPGEEVTVPNLNRPSGQLDPFMSFMLRGVAAALGVSYETISKDYSKTNYSSSRQSLLKEREAWRTMQLWMIRNFHQPIFEAWLDMAVLSGEIDLKGYELFPEKYQGVKWMPRGWAWIDPAKEVAAYKEAVTGGFKSVTAICAEDGIDFEDLILQRKREIDFANQHGVLLDTDLNVNRYGQGNTNSSPKNNTQDTNEDDTN
jgi:lambda family phage portal protein